MNITDLTPELREKLEEAAKEKFPHSMACHDTGRRGYKLGALSDVAAEIHGMNKNNEVFRIRQSAFEAMPSYLKAEQIAILEKWIKEQKNKIGTNTIN